MDLEDKDLEEFAISANAAAINLEELEIHGANRIITAGGIRSMGKKLDTLRSLGVDLEHLRGSSVPTSQFVFGNYWHVFLKPAAGLWKVVP